MGTHSVFRIEQQLAKIASFLESIWVATVDQWKQIVTLSLHYILTILRFAILFQIKTSLEREDVKSSNQVTSMKEHIYRKNTCNPQKYFSLTEKRLCYIPDQKGSSNLNL